MAYKILRLPRVIDRVGYSRSAIYAFVSKGGFPRPIKIGARAVGWLDSDIDAWISERVKNGHGSASKGISKACNSKGGVK